MRCRPKNWKQFQHYKDRSPPWIKLHRELLHDYDFHCLSLASRVLAPMLWLLASENEDGWFDTDKNKAAHLVHISPEEADAAIRELISQGFFECASKALARRKQVALPEERTSTEDKNREEKKVAPLAPARVVASLPDWVPLDAWKGFVEMRTKIRAPLTERAKTIVITELSKLKDAGESVEAVLNQSVERSWRGVFAIKTGGSHDTASTKRTATDKHLDGIASLIADIRSG